MSKRIMAGAGKATVVAIGLLLVSGLSGCGKARVEDQWTLVPVEGVLTYKGQPLASAEVAFYFQGQPPAGFMGSGATTDAEGRFKLSSGGREGAVPGSYKVTISQKVGVNGGPLQASITDGIDMQQLMMQGQVREAMPAKYADLQQSEVFVSVEDGKELYNLDLQ